MSGADHESNFDNHDWEGLGEGIDPLLPTGLPSNASLEALINLTELSQIVVQAAQLSQGAECDVSEIVDSQKSIELDQQLRANLESNGHTEIVDTQGVEISWLLLPFDAPWAQATPQEIEEAGQHPYAYIRTGWTLKLGGTKEDGQQIAEEIIDGSFARGIAKQMQRMRELDLPED